MIGGRKRADIWTLITLLGFAIVLVFLVYPLFDVFKYSFADKETGAPSFSNWVQFFSRAYYLRAFSHSIIVALLTTFFLLCWAFRLRFLHLDIEFGARTYSTHSQSSPCCRRPLSVPIPG